MKFVEALNETVDHVKSELLPDFDFDQFNEEEVKVEEESTEDTELKWD